MKLTCTRRKIIYILAFMLSAFAGVLFFSETTSPLYSDWGYDSAMFQTIGKYWAEGALPYVELFDHKGPMIFLINAAGYALCGRTGVFILQVIFLFISEALAYRLLNGRCPRAVAVAGALLLPVLLAANWEEGNTTEEYILPLLFMSYGLMLRWAEGREAGESDHAPRAAFIYGLSFSFALMTRVTNALGICVGVLMICVALIAKGRWKNLGANALAFILGAAVLTVPFCIYFYAHGALYEMWYGTLLFNFDYSAYSGTAAPEGLVDLIVLFRRYLCGWCLIGCAGLRLIIARRDRRGDIFWLIIALVSTVFMYTLNDYAHYGIILLPMLYIALARLYAPSAGDGARRALRIAAALMAALALMSAGLKAYKAKTLIMPPQAYEMYGDDYISLLAMIPEDERGSFVAFDCPRRIYLETGLRPAFRFFTLQQWMSINSEKFAGMIHAEFAQSNIKWVLTFNIYHQPLVTTDIIDASYELVGISENGLFQLYRLKE